MIVVISRPPRNSQAYRHGMLFRNQNNARQLKGAGYLATPQQGRSLPSHIWILPSNIQPSTFLLQCFSNVPANLFHFHKTHNFLTLSHTLHFA